MERERSLPSSEEWFEQAAVECGAQRHWAIAAHAQQLVQPERARDPPEAAANLQQANALLERLDTVETRFQCEEVDPARAELPAIRTAYDALSAKYLLAAGLVAAEAVAPQIQVVSPAAGRPINTEDDVQLVLNAPAGPPGDLVYSWEIASLACAGLPTSLKR